MHFKVYPAVCNRASKHVLEDPGDECVGYQLLVLDPVRAVLLRARLVVAEGAVYEEDEEVDAVEERYDVVEPTQRTPGETHDPITEKGEGTGTQGARMERRGGGKGRGGKEGGGARERMGNKKISTFVSISNIGQHSKRR